MFKNSHEVRTSPLSFRSSMTRIPEDEYIVFLKKGKKPIGKFFSHRKLDNLQEVEEIFTCKNQIQWKTLNVLILHYWQTI